MFLASPVFGSYRFRPRKTMSRTLPPCTSLVLAGSSGFCGSPQEALSTALPSPPPPLLLPPPPQAVAARATAAAQAAHLACVAPRIECLLRKAEPCRSITGKYRLIRHIPPAGPPVRATRG